MNFGTSKSAVCDPVVHGFHDSFCLSRRPAKICRMPPNDSPLTLRCHPATPARVVRTLEAQASIQANGTLHIDYRLWGDMARLLIPAAQASRRTDQLWEHTCFEVFIAMPGETAYREFNFSPSGQWANYAFSNYRQRDECAEAFVLDAAPTITTRLFAGRLELEAIIAPDALPAGASTLLLGLSAVIEAADVVDGSHSYWALTHTAARPDFHHRDAFTLELAVTHNPN